MPTSAERLRAIKSFKDLVRYFEDELDWPLSEYDFEELTFEYQPSELGLKESEAAKVKTIHQLRPLQDRQPWGIFFVEFEKKRLPVVVLRRILSHLVVKKRSATYQAHTAAWHLDDLLFIAAFGDEATEQREIAFAHFHQEVGDLPTLRVLGWDGADSPLKLEYVSATLKQHLHWPDDPHDPNAWREQWAPAFRHRVGHIIRTADALADELAGLARRIRVASMTLLVRESDQGPLRQLYKAFQTALIHDLSEADFTDTYAQTITYGLLTAAISKMDSSGEVYGTALIASNVTDMVPITNPFLREMLQTFLQVGGRKGGINFDELGIQDVVDLLRGEETDLPAILMDFGNKTQGEDPVIHFYEHFLAAYDKNLKIKRGVFYTPKPVVSFIVRSIHELLKSEFCLEDGLASTITWAEMAQLEPELKIPTGIPAQSPFVVILDPATGTATFLVEVIEVIYRTLKTKWQRQGLNEAECREAWNHYVPRYLLPRIYGYELMMAPYAIAHMKIGLKLRETGYRFSSDERVRIFLTNALEPASDIQKVLEGILPALDHESRSVNDIKRRQKFTVIIGNPPYSNFGQLNKIPFILHLLEDYKRGLNEKKLNITDDFIKFTRLAQYLIQKAGIGVVGVITNNVFIDGLTHRKMRESLIASFSSISVLNLHGSIKKHDRALDGSKDENVFDIQQGVAVNIWVKSPREEDKTVQYYSLLGSRAMKYAFLDDATVTGVEWRRINPVTPTSLLRQNSTIEFTEYFKWMGLKDIFKVGAGGLETMNDPLTVAFDKPHMIRIITDLVGLQPNNFRKTYGIADSSGWSFEKARYDVNLHKDPTSLIRQINYRPFDIRWTFYSGRQGFMSRPRFELFRHLIHPNNLGLCVLRQSRSGEEPAFFVIQGLAGKDIVSSLDRGTVFPLFLIPDEYKVSTLALTEMLTANFTSTFVHHLNTLIGQKRTGIHSLPAGLTPEDIFHYAYAVFHSPSYRIRYAHYLKIDFPRLPLCSSIGLFRALAQMGSKLITLHIVEAPSQLAVSYHYNLPERAWRYKVAPGHNLPIALVFKGPEKPIVEKVDWLNDTVWIDKGRSIGFQGLAENVWNFHIGGYKVCEKWLKDRKGRILSAEDITYYYRIIIALHETIQLMAEIDGLIEEQGGWPDAFASSTFVK